MQQNIINILGTEYILEYHHIQEDDKLDNMEGYTDLFQKIIVIGYVEEREGFEKENKSKILNIKNKILRHEIIHAFLYESGLDCNSNKTYTWAENEEMVDWFAIQGPKIYEIYKELDIL